MVELQSVLKILTVTSFGLMAGIYFIFSNTIMNTFAEIPAKQAAETMTEINRVILNPFFFILFWGSGVGACFVLANFILKGESLTLALGSLIFLTGSVFVTLLVNVPLNKKLESIVCSNKNVVDFWKIYLIKWARWNHVRTICTSIGFVFYLTDIVV